MTGGADGIGRACAIELAKQGCNVAIADICAERAEKTRKELCDLGVKAYAYQVIFIQFEKWQYFMICIHYN